MTAAGMEATVLRLPRIDLSGESVLVHVSSEGPRPLDVKLIGTDSENAFGVSLTSTQTSKLMSKKSKLNQDQWQKVLSLILRGAAQDLEESSLMEDVEAVAKVEEDESQLTIVIRKKIEGITHPLGSIFLPASEDTIQLFDWCNLAIKAKDVSCNELANLRTTLAKKEDEVKKLEDGLAELGKLKKENETQLLEKFSLLLNEKKLKIRDQQRLLACSNVDPVKLAEVESSRAAVSSRSPGPSRRGKRKADQDDESDDSDAGFEKMEVDEKQEEDSEQEQAQTPEDSTADEADSDNEPMPSPPRRSENKGKETGSSNSTTSTAANTAALPPRRNLPFNRKQSATTVNPEPSGSSSKPAPLPAPAEGSETESDDEL